MRHGLDHGLFLYSRRQNSGRFGDWLLIAPPLNLSAALAEELVDRLDATLEATAGGLRSG